MIQVQVCVGSSCHVKGSEEVISHLERLLRIHGLTKQVNLTASFCMGRCRDGVCVTVDGEKLDKVTATNVNEFFNEKIMGRIT
jgi:NADH:ubiquinone oxidoreductase subunit E